MLIKKIVFIAVCLVGLIVLPYTKCIANINSNPGKVIHPDKMDLLYPFSNNMCFKIREIATGLTDSACGNVWYNPKTKMVLVEIISEQTEQAEYWLFPIDEFEFYNADGRMVPDKDGYMIIIP